MQQSGLLDSDPGGTAAAAASAHLVLARKWRPRNFESLVGQDLVVRALRHALDTKRLHHAYLLTGTRGVGKTTIARILAKCVNCETGITSQPCGRCVACTGVDSGRFPDYIEMDAASNRKVEEMTPLLENAAYAPSIGRYKVFVIDEVHMLSAHAFNAMLKTLEEPPEHVIFVLATTDPQKVPVTVLSRCLQFGLRNMSPSAVADHLQYVLKEEGIDADPASTALIGRAAAGSMRDALSLLDQAIALGGGRVDEASVREMLGSVDDAQVDHLIAGLGARDGAALVSLADRWASSGTAFGPLLLALAARLQRIAVAQMLAQQGRGSGRAAMGDDEDPIGPEELSLSDEDLQVWYQIATHAARDLPLAPDPHSGFVMALVRMLAFSPQAEAGSPTSSGAAPVREPRRAEPRRAEPQRAEPQRAEPQRGVPRGTELRKDDAPADAARNSAPPRVEVQKSEAAVAETSTTEPSKIERPPVRAPSPAPASPVHGAASPAPAAASPAATTPAPAAATSTPLPSGMDWPELAARAQATGPVRLFLNKSELVEASSSTIRLRVPMAELASKSTVETAAAAVSAVLGGAWHIDVQIGATGDQTLDARQRQHRQQRQDEADASMAEDPFVRDLIERFDGRIVPDSIKPHGEQRR